MIANRLNNVEEYYFSIKLREVREMIAKGLPVINMGIGSPDLDPPAEVIEAIQSVLVKGGNHGYQNYQGLPELREAIAGFYQKYFNTDVDPLNEILPLMGSKEGIMHISLAFLNPGDEVLLPNPGYPTYTSVTKLVEAEPVLYELDEKNDWLPNLLELSKKDLSRVKLMWINYPHMPTGQRVSLSQLKDIVDFAKKNDIILINDNPYSFVLNTDPISLLQIKGAKENCLELNSLSKSFNMAGWRIGMVLGPKHLIKSILQVKSNMDSGMYYGIQQGAIAALNMEADWFEKINTVYRTRRNLVWKILDQLNCVYDKAAVGLFVWAKIPEGSKAEEMADQLLYQHHVFLTPGTVFGSAGQGYIRISLCTTEKALNEVLNRLS